MPLEDLTGNKYIGDLNENWPLGTDYPSDGDDHIKGTKNVLKKSFPNITGPVNLTQDQLNQGAIPSGTVMMFYQASAPDGWTRVQNLTNDYMIRIVETTDEDSGGSSAGVDNPIVNSKIPTHTHQVAGYSGNQSANHIHGGVTDFQLGPHTHQVPNVVGGGSGIAQGGNYGIVTGGTDAPNLSHQHNFTTGANNANHSHYINLPSGGPTSGTVGNWSPRYMNMILCSRD